MKGEYFKSNFNENSKVILDESDENRFLNSIRKVANLLKFDDNELYSIIFTNNIKGMCAHVAENIDEFLDKMNISFSAEEFLLLLFHELYEEFVVS